MRTIDTFNVEQTMEVGYKLAKLMKNGGVILLDGDLGAGKTVFTMGVAKALNIDGYITSPTFTLVSEYHGDKKLNHFDVYRLEGIDDLDDIGFYEYLEDDAFVVIEWWKKIEHAMPKDTVEVSITKDLEKGLDYRNVSIKFNGKFKSLENKLN